MPGKRNNNINLEAVQAYYNTNDSCGAASGNERQPNQSATNQNNIKKINIATPQGNDGLIKQVGSPTLAASQKMVA
jgi:hypothetical protein